ncbi:MAG: pantetheine-phosphate adenylyltransferase [Candidatus Coatesbacteria bacterium]|nr:pantetheine-phosphate adenylyltransferase [Candidatus Coatesbacteria bacterium]
MRTALFPGTFDPVTNGHLDIIGRALAIFERLVIAVAANPAKGPLFRLEERVSMMKAAAAPHDGSIEVRPFKGLLVDFARELDINVVIRGVRGVGDFEDEFRMALANRKLNPEMETIFLMPSEIYTYLNSSLVKEIARLGGELAPFVPAPVAAALRAKMGDVK